jgi:hypothetical protein
MRREAIQWDSSSNNNIVDIDMSHRFSVQREKESRGRCQKEKMARQQNIFGGKVCSASGQT